MQNSQICCVVGFWVWVSNWVFERKGRRRASKQGARDSFLVCVYVLVLSAEQRLVCERRVERDRTSDASTSCQRCLACAKDTNVDGREGARLQTKATHVQPLGAAFTLHHCLTLVCAVADASCAVCRKATAVGRWCRETFGAGRAVEGVCERVITTVTMGRRGVVEVNRGLRPTLVVSLQGVL